VIPVDQSSSNSGLPVVREVHIDVRHRQSRSGPERADHRTFDELGELRRFIPMELDEVQSDRLRDPVDLVGRLVDEDADRSQRTRSSQYPRLSHDLERLLWCDLAARFGEDQPEQIGARRDDELGLRSFT
jgi:hypothetical protein